MHAPKITYLKDYRPPAYRIPKISLDFDLDPEKTLVTAKMEVERQGGKAESLILNGNKNLKLISLKINGKTTSDYFLDDDFLKINSPPSSFIL